MGNEFFAAKQGDKLMHSSIFADIVCGVVWLKGRFMPR